MPSWPFSRGSTAIFCWYLWCVCVENHWPLHVWVITQLSAPASIRLFSFMVRWVKIHQALPKKTFLGFGRHCTVMHSLSRPVKLHTAAERKCICHGLMLPRIMERFSTCSEVFSGVVEEYGTDAEEWETPEKSYFRLRVCCGSARMQRQLWN